MAGGGPRGGPSCPIPRPAPTHLSGLVDRQADGRGGDEEDAQGVRVVAVGQPEPDAEGLEPIVWVQCLGEGRGGSIRARVPGWLSPSRHPWSLQLLGSEEDTGM